MGLRRSVADFGSEYCVVSVRRLGRGPRASNAACHRAAAELLGPPRRNVKLPARPARVGERDPDHRALAVRDDRWRSRRMEVGSKQANGECRVSATARPATVDLWQYEAQSELARAELAGVKARVERAHTARRAKRSWTSWFESSLRVRGRCSRTRRLARTRFCVVGWKTTTSSVGAWC